MKGMKKTFITGALALVTVAYVVTGCSRDEFTGDLIEAKKQAFEQVFKSEFGDIDPNQTWGFNLPANSETRGITRAAYDPSCPGIDKPYDEAWVANYCKTAKEPNSTNVAYNHDNGYYQGGTVTISKEPVMPAFTESTYLSQTVKYNLPDDDPDKVWYKTNLETLLNDYWAYPQSATSYYNNQDAQNYINSRNAHIDLFLNIVKVLTEGNRLDWITITQQPTKGEYTTTGGTWVADENFVTNFKITGTWNGGISVAGSEGYLPDHVTRSNAERTIVVTGTWNITEDQRIGEFGKIIIANGGTVNVAEGKTLNMVNQARLVVLPGGKLTGAGKVEVNNGNAEGLENYNGGIIDVATFNNNFGKFYNYGEFLVSEYHGGAAESNFYNHNLAAIDHFAGTGSTANARVFNKCQFYVKNNARIRNYEGVSGSALIVDGQLMFSSSEDGTGGPTTVGLAAGALVKCNTLYNNGTSWVGPNGGGYAALEITDKIEYLNWEQDAPENGGFFANNIFVKAGTWTNVPDGNGYHQTDPSDEYNHSLSIAEYKFKNIVANCAGNGNVTIVEDGNYEEILADDSFSLGKKGCTPGFKRLRDESGTEEKEEERLMEQGRVFCEDLGQVSNRDLDYNDVVFDAWIYNKVTYRRSYTVTNGVRTEGEWKEYSSVPSRTVIKLLAAGGTIPIQVAGVDVHQKMGNIPTTQMINTMTEASVTYGGLSWDANYINDVAPVVFTPSTAYTSIISIPIVVKSSTTVYELTAYQGQAPQKFLAPIGTPWPAERCELKLAFPYFENWVQYGILPWDYKNATYLYDAGETSSASTIYSWESPNGLVNQAGGTVSGDRVNYGNNGNYTLCVSGKRDFGDGSFQIALNEALSGGDIISITGYITNSETKQASLCFGYDNDVTNDDSYVYGDADNISLGGSISTHTVTVPSEATGSKVLKITRGANRQTNIFITKLTVTR